MFDGMWDSVWGTVGRQDLGGCHVIVELIFSGGGDSC